MKQQLIRFLAVLAAATLLSACGGGGGGGGGGAQVVTKTVSGTINQSSGAAAAKATAGADLPVQVSSYDAAGTLLSGGRVSATTSGGGQFSTRVPVAAGGYVLIDITKDGYTEFHRRIDFKAAADDVDILGSVDKASTAIQKIASYSNLSSVGIKAANQTFSFAVMRYPNGMKKAVAGSAIRAAKAAGATTELGLSIPADSLTGVSALKADLNTYDPSTDSAKFPGSYTADYKGQQGKMVSLAFDYLKITDADSGESIGKIAAKLAKAGIKKAAAANTVYTRWIPTNSCDTLFQYDDFDTTAAGFQIPVWSLNPSSGKWELIGIGTIYNKDTDTTPATIDASTAPATCKSNGMYMKINVSNEAFLKSYWNLDHIVLTPVLKKVCIGGTVTNGDSSMYLSLYGKGFEAGYTRVGADGKYSLEAVLLNAKETNRTATLSYSDSFGNYNTVDVTLGDSPSCAVKDITLAIPGTVSGVIKNESGGIAYKAVQLQGTTTNRWLYTDANGAFTGKVKKGEDISVYVGYDSVTKGSFRINGTAADYTLEKSDDGSAVVLNDITVTNQAPTASAYLSSYSVKVGKKVQAYFYAYDEEGDYPLTYTLKSGSTTLASGTFASSSSSASAELTPAAGSYPLVLTIADSKSNSRDVSIGTLEVASGNRAPMASLFADRYYVPATSDQTKKDVYLYGYASDNDGDALNYTLKVNGVTVDSGTTQSGYANTVFKYTIPATAAVEQTFAVEYAVSDGTASVKRNATITYGLNHAPSVYVTADKTFVAAGASGTAREVTCTAYGYDVDGDTLTYSWALNNVVQTSATGTSFAYTIPAAATSGQSYDLKVTVSDGAKSSSASCKVTYGEAGDVNVVVQ